MGIRRATALGFTLMFIGAAGCQNAPEANHPQTPAPAPEIEDPTDDNPLLNTGGAVPLGRQCPGKSSKVGRFDAHPGADPCQNNLENHLLYVFLHRAMYVCENGKTIWANFVSGGKGGFRKQKQGDRKVPEGIYELGIPRASANFGIFIPIGYPNAEDRKAGRTGGSVGIHGPARGYACDGSANLFTPWTNGCLAYPSDRHVYELSLWVKKNPDAYIELRAQ